MRIKYYGTGAGEGMPEIFCSCRVCEQARVARGRNIRTRSQAVINSELSIDYPVDTFLHTLHGGLDMRTVRHVLITHSHHDHFMPADVMSRPQGIDGPVHFYISEASGRQFRKSVEQIEEAYRSGRKIRTSNFSAEVHTLTLYQPIRILDYTVIPLRARHDEAIETMNFIIEKNGRSILWAHDTGLFHTEVYEYLRQSGIRFDLVSLDCTLGRGKQITKSHMDLDWCLETAARLREQGNADGETRFVLSHVGHLVERTHDALCMEAEPFGMTVAYDGMRIEI